MDASTLILAILGSNGLFVFIQYMITRNDKKKDTKDEALKEIRKQIAEMRDTESITMYAVFSDKVERVLQKGFADPDDRRDIENMFTRYKNNGWNGDMDARVHKVYELPTQRVNNEQ